MLILVLFIKAFNVIYSGPCTTYNAPGGICTYCTVGTECIEYCTFTVLDTVYRTVTVTRTVTSTVTNTVYTAVTSTIYTTVTNTVYTTVTNTVYTTSTSTATVTSVVSTTTVTSTVTSTSTIISGQIYTTSVTSTTTSTVYSGVTDTQYTTSTVTTTSTITNYVTTTTTTTRIYSSILYLRGILNINSINQTFYRSISIPVQSQNVIFYLNITNSGNATINNITLSFSVIGNSVILSYNNLPLTVLDNITISSSLPPNSSVIIPFNMLVVSPGSTDVNIKVYVDGQYVGYGTYQFNVGLGSSSPTLSVSENINYVLIFIAGILGLLLLI